MDLGKPLHPGVIAEREFHHRLSLPVPAPDGGWIVSVQDHPDVVLLDPQLNEIQRLDLQAHSQHYCDTAVAMSRDGQRLALSGRTQLRIFNRRGKLLRRLSHEPWYPFYGSSCFFDGDDRLWYVRPRDKPSGDDKLTILHPQWGTILVEQTIESRGGYSHLFPCPDHAGALIHIGCGQDGSFLYLARLTAAGLTVERYPFDDRTFFGGFSPNGREFVTGAHQGDAIKVHSFPSGQVVASVESDTVFAADDLISEYPDSVGYQAIFLDDDHFLTDTQFGRMLLFERATMQPKGIVWPPGYSLTGYDLSGKETDDPSKVTEYVGSLSFLHPAGVGRVLTVYGPVIRLLDVSNLL